MLASPNRNTLAPVSIAYHCDPTLRCTFIVWDGDVTPEQWVEQVERVAGDRAFPPGPLLFGDLSTVGDAPSITTDVIAEMARRWLTHANGTQPDAAVAIVANRSRDKVRQFVLELERSGIRAMVFEEHRAACTWLGLDTESARTILKGLREDAAVSA